MKQWYAVQTQPSSEDRAVGHLQRQGYDIYLPRYARKRRHARRIDTVASPLFPGYLFVRLDLERMAWRSVDGTRGVIRLVRRGDRPAPLPEGVVERLRDCEDESGLHTPASLMVLAPGTPLRIVGGAFDDHVGVFERMSADSRVVLMLSLLGRTVQVSLPRSAVDAA